MMICETWIPCGPNSLASDWARARRANFPAAKVARVAPPFRLAVAPEKIRVGGLEVSPVDGNINGRVACAKLNPPFLLGRGREVLSYIDSQVLERIYARLHFKPAGEFAFRQFQKRPLDKSTS